MGPITRFLAADHGRLDALLRRALVEPGTLDRTAYAAFRAGLLRHIAMEEKVLLPAAARAAGGPLPRAAKLRLDHGALAALLVPTPTSAIVRLIRRVLEAHNALEEGADGVYEVCDRLAGAQAEALRARLAAVPVVPEHVHVDGPHVLAAARRALERSGVVPEYDELGGASQE